jgi:AcrR family transcriptional regulator
MRADPETLADTKGMIVRQAKGLFAARGYRGVSVREIAEACGLGKATLYHHFRDKRELYLEVLDSGADQLVRVLGAAARQGNTSRERITNIATAYFSLQSAQRHFILLTLRDVGGLEQEFRELITRRGEEMLRPIRAAIEEGMASGELRPVDSQLASLALLSMLHILITCQLLILDAEVGEAEVRHMVDLFMEGVTA